jgi:hypothetical protein
MALDWFGANDEAFNKKLTEKVVDLALQFHIMTQFTSFVAVDEKSHTSPGQPVLTEVPVDVPEGTSLSGLFREGDKVVDDSLRQALIQDTNETLNTWQGQVMTGTQPEPKAVLFGSWQAIAKWFEPVGQKDSDDLSNSGAGKTVTSGKKVGFGAGSGGSGPRPLAGAGGMARSNKTYKAPARVQIIDEAPEIEDFKATLGSTSDTSLPETQFQVIGRSQGAVSAPTPIPSPVPKPRIARAAFVPPPPPALLHSANKAVPPPVTLGGGMTGDEFPSGGVAYQIDGASNGTIGPQGSFPYPAMFEEEGKVAEIARSLHIGIIAKLLDFGTIAFGFFFIAKGLFGITTRRRGSWRPIVFGVTWIIVGFTFCLALIPWVIMIGCAQLWRRNKSKQAPPVPLQSPAEQESAFL